MPGEAVIFFSVGLMSRFGEWCEAVTARLVEHALGPVRTIYADTLDEFVTQVIGAESPYITVSSHHVVGQLWAALARANRHFTLVLDDPHLALENLVVHHGLDFLEATRMIAKSCASMVSCAPISGALVLRADRDAADPMATAGAIARHFQLSIGDAEIAGVLGPLAEVDLQIDRERHQLWWQQLDESQRALVAGAVDPYLAQFAGGDLGPVIWERDFFYISEEPPAEIDPPASRPIDVTGRPRYLLYGPYITLPPGSWSATVALGFSAEAAELSYVVEVCAGTEIILATVPLQPGQERVIETNLNFSLAAPEMVEIRILNERAAFDGRLALGHVVLTPAGTIRPETRSYLEATLGA
jgi:hypothetical protein